MGVASYVGVVDIRGRWRRYAGIALLLGLTAGLALFAVAGARRTQSAYPRFLRSVNASTMAVGSLGFLDPAANKAIAEFPEVTQSRTYVGFQVYVLVEGRPDLRQAFEGAGTFDGRYFDQDRFTATRGRLPDPGRADEVAVNELTATRLGYRIGQHLDLGTYSADQFADPSFFEQPPPPQLRTSVTLVGIGVFPDEVLQDESDRTTRMLLTPAFSEAAKDFVTYGLQGLVLRDGDADVDMVKQRLPNVLPPGTIYVRVTSDDEFHALQAVRPLSFALATFGVIMGLASLVLVGQALAQQLRIEGDERAVLRSLGATPVAILRSGLTGAAVAIVGGAALAVLLAVAASPAMPIGPVRRVDGSSGVDVDVTVLGVGALAIASSLFVLTVVVLWHEAPHRVVQRRRSPARASRLVGAASSSGMAPTAVTGLRFAFEPSGTATAVPARSVMAGTVIAVAALVGAITFGSSMSTLVNKPRLFGWSWDATVLAGNGYDNIAPDAADAILGGDRNVAVWSGAYFGSDTIDGHDVPLLGMEPGSGVQPPILHGRAIEGAGEAVLGAATAAQLGKGIGDTVRLAGRGSPHQVTVVGIATFPTIGVVNAAHTSLGVGALVVPQLVPGSELDITGTRTGALGPHAIFIRYRPGTDPDQELAHLQDTTKPLAGFAGLDVVPVQRPVEIVSSSSLGSAPVLLAGSLVLGATASLGLALSAAVRRRRHDLALLKVLGFTQRQLAATVFWHATATVVVGLLLGMPLGVAAGRELWLLFARQLDVVARGDVPVVVLLGIALGTLAIANAVAAVPAWSARRVDSSALLVHSD
jgi:ABC-type antimicrobial peptide transport system permease subunit